MCLSGPGREPAGERGRGGRQSPSAAGRCPRRKCWLAAAGGLGLLLPRFPLTRPRPADTRGCSQAVARERSML